MYSDHETFANPPLVLVTAEIRFSDAPRLRQQETLDAVAIAFDNQVDKQGQGLAGRQLYQLVAIINFWSAQNSDA